MGGRPVAGERPDLPPARAGVLPRALLRGGDGRAGGDRDRHAAAGLRLRRARLERRRGPEHPRGVAVDPRADPDGLAVALPAAGRPRAAVDADALRQLAPRARRAAAEVRADVRAAARRAAGGRVHVGEHLGPRLLPRPGHDRDRRRAGPVERPHRRPVGPDQRARRGPRRGAGPGLPAHGARPAARARRRPARHGRAAAGALPAHDRDGRDARRRRHEVPRRRLHGDRCQPLRRVLPPLAAADDHVRRLLAGPGEHARHQRRVGRPHRPDRRRAARIGLRRRPRGRDGRARWTPRSSSLRCRATTSASS